MKTTFVRQLLCILSLLVALLVTTGCGNSKANSSTSASTTSDKIAWFGAFDITASNGEGWLQQYAEDVYRVIRKTNNVYTFQGVAFGTNDKVRTLVPEKEVTIARDLSGQLKQIKTEPSPKKEKTYWLPMLRAALAYAEAHPTQPFILTIGADGECHDDLKEVTKLADQIADLPNLRAVYIGPLMTNREAQAVYQENWYDVYKEAFASIDAKKKLFLCMRDNDPQHGSDKDHLDTLKAFTAELK